MPPNELYKVKNRKQEEGLSIVMKLDSEDGWCSHWIND